MRSTCDGADWLCVPRHLGRRGFGPGGPRGFGPGGPRGFGRRAFGPGGFDPGAFGPGGFGPRGPFWGPGGFGRGRRRRGDVRLALLMLLAEQPRNGYQLMQEIEQRSEGHWRPSPGSIYPALAQLEDEGLITAVAQEAGRAFTLTEAGRAHLDSLGEQPAPWEAEEPAGADALRDLRAVAVGLAKAAFQLAQAGEERQWRQAADVLAEARRAIYRILAEEPREEPGAGNSPESD
jgi:DNA-binding PadR family transcriptional regulator